MAHIAAVLRLIFFALPIDVHFSVPLAHPASRDPLLLQRQV